MLRLLATIAHAEPLTLADALSSAFDANPELQVATLGLARAEAELRAAAGVWDPRVSGGVYAAASSAPSNARIDGTARLVSEVHTVTARIDQALPTGGQVGLGWSESSSSSNSRNVIAPTAVSDRLDLSLSQPLASGLGPDLGPTRARLAVERQTLVVRQARERLVIDVSTAYWALVAARTSHQLALRSREVAEQSAAETQTRYEQGFAGSGEVLQVRRAVGVARQGVVVAEAASQQAESELERLIGRAGSQGLDPTERPDVPDQVPTVDEVLRLARSANAEWLLQQHDARSAGLDVRAARRAALPDLDLAGAVGSNGLGDSAAASRRALGGGEFVDWSVGTTFVVSLPARTLRAELTAARVDEEVARTTLDVAAQDLALAVESAVRRLSVDRARVALSDETVAAAELALEADQDLFREGRCPPRQVVDSLEALDHAQAAQLEAQIDLQQSMLEVRRLAGTLLE